MCLDNVLESGGLICQFDEGRPLALGFPRFLAKNEHLILFPTNEAISSVLYLGPIDLLININNNY